MNWNEILIEREISELKERIKALNKKFDELHKEIVEANKLCSEKFEEILKELRK